VSGFIICTDSEPWAGNIHPAQALREYRSEFVGDAKAVVVGMASTGFTLADPNDCGMMDAVGFDTTVPAVIADFVRFQFSAILKQLFDGSQDWVITCNARGRRFESGLRLHTPE
jgi:hypothetical protein